MMTTGISELIWASRYRGTDRNRVLDASIEVTWGDVIRTRAESHCCGVERECD